MATSRWFVISYDFSKQSYGTQQPKYLTNNNLPREKMILFLLGLGCNRIESYTDSTIHFQVSVKNRDTFWDELFETIRTTFPNLYFSINLIAFVTREGEQHDYYNARFESDTKDKNGFKTNFDNDVKTIIDKLVQEKKATKK